MIKGFQITMLILVVVSNVSRRFNACPLLFRDTPLEFHVATTESSAATMESHVVTMETQVSPWSSVSPPWSLHGVPCLLHGVPCLHHEIPWKTARNTMEFHETFLAGMNLLHIMHTIDTNLTCIYYIYK